MKILHFLFATSVVVLAAPTAVRPCSCVMVSNSCGFSKAFDPGGVIFLGQVVSKVEVQEPATFGNRVAMVGGYAIHFVVKENFHGATGLGQEIVVNTGRGGGDCGYPFVVGTKYLVHAAAPGSELTTSICSGTKPEVMVGGLLRELRAIRDGARVDDLFGTIGIGPTGAGYEDLAETRPLPDVSVRITEGTGTVFTIKTDEHGAYAFSSLPRGTYRIEPDLPGGLSTWQAKPEKPLAIDIDDKDGTGAGCQVDIFSRPDGQISGTVLDATGKGVPGFITIQPADPREAEIARRHGGLPGCDTEDGNFLLPQISAGRYRLEFHPKVGERVDFGRVFYWPRGGRGADNVIELAFGQHIDKVLFEIP
ncbi:MAG TPA: carboxypeptidase regulatory-like domain-containing protein [Candidatus Bathyarchaeia archaeon]|jgi:hypothetical protein|nr:carboxypeptidase regulatory-like domain-containing protein [Candidatus Bathyarchaeia archaeon]